jgi:hypothetical protein
MPRAASPHSIDAQIARRVQRSARGTVLTSPFEFLSPEWAVAYEAASKATATVSLSVC